MPSVSKSLRWRWLALVLVALNAIHGLLLEKLHPSLPGIAEISAKNESLFTPAGYAFAIWGLIYVAFVTFCVWIILPAQRTQPAYDPLARGLIAYAILGMAWEETFIREQIGLSVVIIGGMFVIGALLFGLAKKRLWSGIGRALHYAPFGLFFGWISVAALTNATSWLISVGWEGGRWGEGPWTVLLLGATVLLGMLVSRRWRDSIYPLVILWSIMAIWEKQRQTDGLIASVALGGAMILTLWTLINAGWIRSHSVLLRQREKTPPLVR